ncbi:MAG: 1-deoxy-D-xylulose-5-phosphate reductoisomerase [Gammaproteobacteria bacterium]|nr:1-deoxy-D-xylulose-5-phosphate reductoisomerase [Gammaproteobacteria bacterium]MDH5628529.1 1-deoxy-D-xylulose-5-phosphate reductoisomerase [Gammaproteobacteria bacterium]
MNQQVAILGSTGSIGQSTLDVIARHPDKYQVKVLTANSNIETMLSQCIQFQPNKVVMADPQSAEKLKVELSQHQSRTLSEIIVTSGSNELANAVSDEQLDIVVAAIVGAAGLLPTLAAVEAGHRVLLANKEALVMSGEIFMQSVQRSGATLLPVDSEHNAIFQCLADTKEPLKVIDKILLTGSGGPFRALPIEQLEYVTPEQACAHPNWDMGKKISVDSATMMNKGLELIEASFMFQMPADKIQIVVHPQSIVHSMVSYVDGSVLAQMGNPDMRTPIAHCLAWPDRIDAGVESLDFYKLQNLTFDQPDYQRFPCLKLAEEALRIGGTAPCIINAANEIAVAAFLAGEIRFTGIAEVIRETLGQIEIIEPKSLDDVIKTNDYARQVASKQIENGTGNL